MTLQFGLSIPADATPGADPVALARRAEDLGFDFVSSSDHPCGREPSYEAWTMLAWIAASTSRIKVATKVLGVPYRNPAMVAKMAESLDRLSGGRLILGLGGGYSDEEFRAFGLGVPTPAEKVDGLAEAIAVIRGLWSRPAFSFDGRYHRTTEADLEPKPGHHIPVWLGTFGPKALALTGRLADGWIPSLGYVSADELIVMRDRVLAAAGDREFTCALNLQVQVDEHPDADPSVVAGSPEAVAERLTGFIRAGFTALNFIPAGRPYDEQNERLAREVLPTVRAHVDAG
ncbi:MAG TPA: LLM class flavin-dependent oxidoreductase [Streptosporangiaceae bacterium]|jgi:alkanesulfonate monooxygenase SsuD/methylene tetrahydromethanopterin reductase-like flavin-dependent oxidoreductase (luciferase family)|nr:LLM class flavin-dependent oxidoreductase [Streptosporangiaceae bacterium]